MTLTFNGTAVYVYGAKRTNHGFFSGESKPCDIADVLAQLDGGSVALISSFANPNEFQQVIFSAGGLSANQEHTVVSLRSLTNLTLDPHQSTVANQSCRNLVSRHRLRRSHHRRVSANR